MEEPTKIVFMGTPVFAVPSLEILINHEDFDVLAVVTQEDKKVGRKQVLTASPVKIAAQDADISVLQPPSLQKNPEIRELLKDMEPDIMIVIAYGQILPPEILEIPKYGCINIHGSLLPQYRGASPVEESLKNGDAETGLTFIQMDEKMDHGPILHIQRAPIDPTESADTLRSKLSVLAAGLLPIVLQDILDGVITPIEQNESNTSYCHKISKQDGLIDPHTMTAQEIHNRIRAYTPWPSCFLTLDEKKLKLLEIEVDVDAQEAAPGQAIERGKNGIGIGTKKGLIILKKVQLEGKSPMEIQDFLRGRRDLFKKLLASPKNKNITT